MFKPPGAYIRRGDLTYGFFALPVWGTDIRRGLYMEGLMFGILRHLGLPLMTLNTSDHQEVLPASWDCPLTQQHIFPVPMRKVSLP